MSKPLRKQDNLTLLTLINENEGCVDREDALQAFKRAGARVGNVNGRLHVVFGTRQLPICKGQIYLSTSHTTFREALRSLARDVLHYSKLQANGIIPKCDKKHLGTSINEGVPKSLQFGIN